MVDWTDIERIDSSLCKALRQHFNSPLQVCAAFDDQREALGLVEDALGNSYGAARRDAISRALLDWQQASGNKMESLRRAEMAERTMHGKQPRASGEVIGIADQYDTIVAGSPMLGLAALESHLAKRAKTGNTARTDEEDRSKKKWALHLADIIIEAKLPAVATFRDLQNANAAWVRAFGSRRSKTLRNRARAWKKLRDWLIVTTGQAWPDGMSILLQYLEERNEVQPMGKTVPMAIHSSLSLLELVGQVPAENRLSEDQLWLESVKSWTAELSRDAPPRKQADLYTVAIAVSAELTLANAAAPLGQRFYCFVLLLLWGTMRCDDMQNVDPASMELSQIGLKFILRRTKTSGPGKPVGELHGFVAREVSLSGVDWLQLCMDLLEDGELRFSRDFFAISFKKEWGEPEQSFLEPDGLATMLRKLLLTLPAVVRRGGGLALNLGTMLISPEMASFWTGHSARHTLPSWAAAAGIGKEDRDYLGRWSTHTHIYI